MPGIVLGTGKPMISMKDQVCPYRAFILVWMAEEKKINCNMMSDNAMPRHMMIFSRKGTFVIEF